MLRGSRWHHDVGAGELWGGCRVVWEVVALCGRLWRCVDVVGVVCGCGRRGGAFVTSSMSGTMRDTCVKKKDSLSSIFNVDNRNWPEIQLSENTWERKHRAIFRDLCLHVKSKTGWLIKAADGAMMLTYTCNTCLSQDSLF